LRNKIEGLDYIFPNDTLEYLAGQFDSNVRDLEGIEKFFLSRNFFSS
ncbi:Chromosomal replication initiator protein DnaA, partial [human gut metagenome]